MNRWWFLFGLVLCALSACTNEIAITVMPDPVPVPVDGGQAQGQPDKSAFNL